MLADREHVVEVISIHALRKESDAHRKRVDGASHHFNPRSP